MNQKELNEIRRRMVAGKNNIGKIYGCYVNGNREIVSYLEESLGRMPELEAEKYMSLFKKTLSGKLTKHLIDIVFSMQQVQDSEEHKLLMSLRDTNLNDKDVREQFYQKVIQALDMEDCAYLLLLASDAYDVPHRGKDDSPDPDGSDGVFRYFICAVCPVKDGKPELGYFAGDNEFHGYATNQIVAPPELGFMFPAFDDRAANLYNALLYSKNIAQLHHEFIDAVFHTETPMSAEEQKESFCGALTDALEEDCSYEVVQAVHEQLRERIEEHKESKNPEPLDITAREVGEILLNGGVSKEHIQAFEKKCDEIFGDSAVLNPVNIIDSGKFELSTPQAKITIDPEVSYLIETRVIDGKRYVLIPADEGVEVNGLSVKLPMVDASEDPVSTPE